MTFTQPFGKPKDTKTVDRDATPQQKKSEDGNIPSGVNKEVWAEAEKAVTNQTGGFSGVGKEGRKAQIQKQYDQMVENDKQTKAWAGNEPGPGGILGDV